MGLLSKLFKKKNSFFTISKKQEENLVCFLPKSKPIKLNTKIIVPQNFCAITLSKEKLLDVIPSGEYELNGLTITKTCKLNKLDKPTKKGYKQTFNADFYFVNNKEFSIQSSFYIKKLKKQINFSAIINVVNPKEFLQFLIEEKAVFDNDFAQSELTFYISQQLYYYFLDNKQFELENFKEFLKSCLQKIGINLVGFNLENTNIISNNEDFKMLNDEKETKPNSLVENNNEILNSDEGTLNSNFNNNDEYYNNALNIDYTPNTNNQNKTTNYNSINSSMINLEDITSPSIQFFSCPNCNAKLPKDAKICFNCGQSFVEKNLCENCGHEIPANEYVCPNCKSVILQ